MSKKKDPLSEGIKAAMQMCIMLCIAKELRDMDKPLKVMKKALSEKPNKQKPRKDFKAKQQL